MAYNASSDGTAALGRFSRIAQEEWEQIHSSLPQEALLAAARARELPVIGGLALLHAQAELAFELFIQ